MRKIFPDFAVAEAWLEASLKCWSLQQNAGDLAVMNMFFHLLKRCVSVVWCQISNKKGLK